MVNFKINSIESFCNVEIKECKTVEDNVVVRIYLNGIHHMSLDYTGTYLPIIVQEEDKIKGVMYNEGNQMMSYEELTTKAHSNGRNNE